MKVARTVLKGEGGGNAADLLNLIKRDMIATIENDRILSDKILIDFMTRRNKKSLKDLKGKIAFRDDYDYKSMRSAQSI